MYRTFNSINPNPFGKMDVVMDVEMSNRCNAQCPFCPRDALPSLGHMKTDVFHNTIKRVKEAGLKTVSFAGRGESMQNPKFEEFIKYSKAQGLYNVVVTNGSHFNPHNIINFKQWGVDQVTISMSDFGHAYEGVYKLPFKSTMSKIVKFIKFNNNKMPIGVVIVDHGKNSPSIDEQEKYWQKLGVNCVIHAPVSRAGASSHPDQTLFDKTTKHTQEAQQLLSTSRTTPVCSIPFLYQNVTYKGEYVLCFADWESKLILGNVKDHSYKTDILPKLLHELAVGNEVCTSCEQNPLNQIRESILQKQDPYQVLEHLTIEQEKKELESEWFSYTGKQVRQNRLSLIPLKQMS